MHRRAGRPLVQVDRGRVEDLLLLNFTISQIARILNVSRTTLYKNMQQYCIAYNDRYSHISDDRLKGKLLKMSEKTILTWVKL
jgi:DNA invertase Pin-like site-specific DNA recombinase